MLASNTYPGQGLDQDRNVVGERVEQARKVKVGDPIQEGAFWDGQRWVFWNGGRWAFYRCQHLEDWRKEPVVLLELKSDSSEYGSVTEHFLSSMCLTTASIQRVFRVQNWTLWHQFKRKRTEMMELWGGEPVKERMLFHGTPCHNVDSICRTGFDYRRCQSARYGRGVYFAKRSNTTHLYTLITLVGDHYPEVIQSAFPLPPQPSGLLSSTAHQLTDPQALTQCWQQPQNGSGLQRRGALPPLATLPPPVGQQYWPQLNAADPYPPPHHPVGVVQLPPVSLAGSSGLQAGFRSGLQAGFPGLQAGFFGPPRPRGVVHVPGGQQHHAGQRPMPCWCRRCEVSQSTPSFPSSDMGPVPGFPRKGLRYMFVSRVLVGRSMKGCCFDDSLPAYVDSTVDSMRAPKVFAIFNNSQAYPEYLLEYFSD